MGQVIALDSMVFIYLFEADRRYLKMVESIFRRIESGQVQGVTSYISVIEALSPVKYSEKETLVSEITRFFEETHNLSIIPIDGDIALESARLRREYPNMKTPDAIQIATALVRQAEIFMTNDQKLSQLKLPNLRIKQITEIS